MLRVEVDAEEAGRASEPAGIAQGGRREVGKRRSRVEDVVPEHAIKDVHPCCMIDVEGRGEVGGERTAPLAGCCTSLPRRVTVCD
jgi:hypothetical protein